MPHVLSYRAIDCIIPPMMALKSGTQLGHYEIQCSLGAGGMGEVYRARDSKPKRDVALKVLPEAVASNALCMARFKREAELLAALNHSNIAAIYGLEESSGTQALVMELVEGPTLGDRISQGAIPLDEALPIAKQIAEAFEYAHEHGVIHRDLKPSNVKIRPDGTVKVLDFGLAKALEDDPVASGIANSPTMSHMATMAGIILGTAAYMSPEQAKGKAADRRVDIWSFGCVLYEMLTGKMAFSGETAAEILAAVIRAEPDWSQLDSVPPRMEDLIARCLRKDPRQRLQAFGDARIGIEEYLANPIFDSVQANLSGPSRDGGARLALLPWALLGLAATAPCGGFYRLYSPGTGAGTCDCFPDFCAAKHVILSGKSGRDTGPFPRRSAAGICRRRLGPQTTTLGAAAQCCCGAAARGDRRCGFPVLVA
jgi:eukaryotic-like serine/threonine-protein kinase